MWKLDLKHFGLRIHDNLTKLPMPHLLQLLEHCSYIIKEDVLKRVVLC